MHGFIDKVVKQKSENLIKKEYRNSANSFPRNYSFLDLTLCTVTFIHSMYIKVRNYSREETICGNLVSTNDDF